jgi:hypothetical protein
MIHFMPTVADLIGSRLGAAGVPPVFSVPGGGSHLDLIAENRPIGLRPYAGGCSGVNDHGNRDKNTGRRADYRRSAGERV